MAEMGKRMRLADDWRLNFISETKFGRHISPFRANSLFRAAIGRKSKPSVRKLAAHSVHGMNEVTFVQITLLIDNKLSTFQKYMAYIGKGGKFYLERRIDKFRWTIPIDLKDFWQDKMFFRLQADCFLSSHIDNNCIKISTYACPTCKNLPLKEGLKIVISPDKRPRSVMNLIKNGATLFILYSDSEGQDRNELWNCAEPNKPRRIPFPDISGLVPARDQHMSFTEGWTIGQTGEILIKETVTTKIIRKKIFIYFSMMSFILIKKICDSNPGKGRFRWLFDFPRIRKRTFGWARGRSGSQSRHSHRHNWPKRVFDGRTRDRTAV